MQIDHNKNHTLCKTFWLKWPLYTNILGQCCRYKHDNFWLQSWKSGHFGDIRFSPEQRLCAKRTSLLSIMNCVWIFVCFPKPVSIVGLGNTSLRPHLHLSSQVSCVRIKSRLELMLSFDLRWPDHKSDYNPSCFPPGCMNIRVSSTPVQTVVIMLLRLFG